MEIAAKNTSGKSTKGTGTIESSGRKPFTVNGIILLAIGSLVVLASIVVYFFVLRGVFGRFTVGSNFLSELETGNLFKLTEPKVAVLYSKYTENMLPEGSTWLSDNLITWKKYLGNQRLNYTVIYDSDIEKGNHLNYNILVLPGSKSLSDKEIQGIKKFLDQGGSVFATSGTASYAQDGKWRGWEFFSEVYGLKFTREIERDEFSKIHTLRGNLPLTANIPTGYPLKIATWDRPIAVSVLEPRTTQVSFWYNYRLEDGLVREEVKKTAGIVYGNYGKGRFVWFGFELNSVIGIQEDWINFDRLFQNSISWLSYKTIGFIKDWPESYDAAAILVPTLGLELNNVNNLLPILRSEGVKATFFVEPSTAEKNSTIIKNLFSFGDVGAIVDIGYLASVNDTINKLNDLSTQINLFQNAKSRISFSEKYTINGIIPLYGLFDNNSLHAMANSGLKYIITDSLTDRSVPRTIILGNNTMISITKTARDDYEVIRDYGLKELEFQTYTYKEDVDRVLFEGGLYVFKMHSEFQLRPENVSVVQNVIRDLKSKKYWIATAGEIYDWWIKRNKLEMRVDYRGERRLAVNISNPGKEDVKEFMVKLDLQVPVRNIAISTEIIGHPVPKYNYDESTHILYLTFTNMKAGDSRLIYVDFDYKAL